MKMIRSLVPLVVLCGLSACGGDKVVDQTCDEPQRYQMAAIGNRVEPPEGLDPLNEYEEMPIPRAQDASVRPPGSRCVELPPSVGMGG